WRKRHHHWRQGHPSQRRRHKARYICTRGQAKIVGANVIESRLMAVCAFVREEVEGAVLLDRASDGHTILRTGIGRLVHVAEWVRRLDVPVAKVSERAAVNVIRSGFRDDV